MTLPRSAIVTSAGVGVLLLLSGCASNGADSAGVATPDGDFLGAHSRISQGVDSSAEGINEIAKEIAD